MSSILDTSSLYHTYSQVAQSSNASLLQGTLGSVNGETSDEQLMEACKSFESYFVQQVLEETKKALVGKDEEEEGEYMQYFGDILTEQYANQITESGSIGLAKQLYESVKGTYNL